jgi:hypothetical protein
MRAFRILFRTSLLLMLSAGAATAQADLSAWPQVRMELMAIDAEGNPLPALPADAVFVNEGRRPHAIASLAPAPGPQSICILIDASDVMSDRLDPMLAKARRLLQRLPATDEVCLAHYSGALTIDQKLTADRSAAVNALAPITASGRARLRDAILQLSGYMRQSAQYRSRAIVLFSDGVDQHSAAGKDQWRLGMEAEGAPVVHLLCMPLGFGHAAWKQEDATKGSALHLVAPGGGLVYFPHTITEFDAMVDHLSDYLQARYVLTFTADNPARDGSERRINIFYGPAHREADVMLRAPTGYIAPAH